MSDVYGINARGKSFWIESKSLHEWPKRDSTAPLAHVFEPGQVPFLKEILTWNGSAYVLLKVIDDWLLLPPKASIDLVNMTKAQLNNYAHAKGLDDIISFLEEL